MSEKLKPCPFCGSADVREWQATGARDAQPPEAMIQCFGCGLAIDGPTPDYLYRLRKQWNNRPGEATARREALNEVTKELIDQHQNPGEKIQLLTNWSARSVLKVITKLLKEKP